MTDKYSTSKKLALTSALAATIGAAGLGISANSEDLTRLVRQDECSKYTIRDVIDEKTQEIEYQDCHADFETNDRIDRTGETMAMIGLLGSFGLGITAYASLQDEKYKRNRGK